MLNQTTPKELNVIAKIPKSIIPNNAQNVKEKICRKNVTQDSNVSL